METILSCISINVLYFQFWNILYEVFKFYSPLTSIFRIFNDKKKKKDF